MKNTYMNEEMAAISKSFGQGFVVRLSEYIMNKRVVPTYCKEVADGYVLITLRYKGLKEGYVPFAHIEHYVRSENGVDTGHGRDMRLGDARPTMDDETLKELTFTVNLDNLVKVGTEIQVKSKR